MDDPLAIWGAETDADASSEAPSAPEEKPVVPVAATSSPPGPAAASLPSAPAPPAPTRSDDDDEPGWGLTPSSPIVPSHPPQKIDIPPPSPGLTLTDVPTPPAPGESILEPHKSSHPAPPVVETSTEGVAIEAAAAYYETEPSRPSSASASRRASGHSTPTGVHDKAGLKLSTMTAPPTPDEHLPGNLPNPSGPLAVFSPALSPSAPGGATRITGRPGSAHPVLLRQHLTRLRQQNGEAEDKGKGKAVDVPIPFESAPAHSETQKDELLEPADADALSSPVGSAGRPEPEADLAAPDTHAEQETEPAAPDSAHEPEPAPVDGDGEGEGGTAGFPDDDGFDDFGEPGEFTEGDADFGDFGDFGEAEAVPAPAPAAAAVAAPVAAPPAEPTLKVPHYPPGADTDAVSRALSEAGLLPWLFSLPPPSGGESMDRIARLGRDGIRQTGGTAQVLGGQGGATALLERMKDLPDLPPVVWERSRTRAMHRHSLALPPEGPKPPARTLSVTKDLSRSTSPATPRRSNSGIPSAQEQTPAQAQAQAQAQTQAQAQGQETVSPNEPPLGSRLDRAAAQAVLGRNADSLHLLSVPVLRGLVDSASSLTVAASAELTHWLTVRDALAADAETYNTMIRDLVVGASARLGPGAPPPSSRSGGKKSAMRFTMGAGIPRPQSPAVRSPSGSAPASRAGTPVALAGRSASGRQTPSGSR